VSVSETVRLIVPFEDGLERVRRPLGGLPAELAVGPGGERDARAAGLHKADILALLPPPRIELAKLMIWRLRSLGFRPYLNDKGVLLIADAHATGKKRRDVSQYLPIARVFDEIVAGLANDPGLLDSHTAGKGGLK